MKFARFVFSIAGVWGIFILTPLYFMFNIIGEQDPPPITHPGFYYGFVGAGLAWQFAFFVIAQDPARYRPLILISIFEKWSFGAALVVLYMQHRIHSNDLIFCATDSLLGLLFLFAYFKTRPALGARV